MPLSLSHFARVAISVLGMLGGAVALYLGKSIFIPLIIAAILAAMLWPFVVWLNRQCRVPWVVCCFLTLGLLVLANMTVFLGFALAVPRIVQDLPNPNNPEEQKKIYIKLREQVKTLVPGNVDEALPADPDASSVFAYVKKTFEGEFITKELLDLGKIAMAWLWQSVLILFILLFLLLEGEMIARRIKDIFGPTRATQTAVAAALGEIAESVRAYLVWRTIVNCGLGIVLGLVYQFMGLRQPWTWGLLTAVLSYVPYLGTIIAGIPPLIDAFVYCSPWHAFAIGLIYVAVVTFEGYVIVPVVMGRSMDLNATTVMISCLFWDLVWGTPGLFLAMPLMAGVRAVCLHVEGWEAWGILMSTNRSQRMASAPPPPVDPHATTTLIEAYPQPPTGS